MYNFIIYMIIQNYTLLFILLHTCHFFISITHSVFLPMIRSKKTKHGSKELVLYFFIKSIFNFNFLLLNFYNISFMMTSSKMSWCHLFEFWYHFCTDICTILTTCMELTPCRRINWARYVTFN